jgi:histidinol-phosphatase (PHP family)
MPIRADYHLHTPRCKHAAGPIEAYVERALVLGLSEIGFSDHNPLPDGRGSNVRMDEWELEHYVKDVLTVRQCYQGEIAVRLGLELDYIAGLEDYLQRQIAAYPWDYLIGSVHYLDVECTKSAWPYDYRDEPVILYEQYFAMVERLVTSGYCDILAHLDIPKRSGAPLPDGLQPRVDELLAVIARQGVAVEINTSGFRHPELTNAQPYPSFEIATAALARGIPFVVSSDAHHPSHVGLEFSRVEGWLRRQGCRQVALFAGRQRRMVEL